MRSVSHAKHFTHVSPKGFDLAHGLPDGALPRSVPPRRAERTQAKSNPRQQSPPPKSKPPRNRASGECEGISKPRDRASGECEGKREGAACERNNKEGARGVPHRAASPNARESLRRSDGGGGRGGRAGC
jgi:hypothetical protein